MQSNIPKVNLFNHYNLVVFLVFLIIIVFATAIATYRYQFGLESHHKTDLIKLAEQANIIDRSLYNTEQTLKGLRQFAQYYLDHPNDLPAQRPSLEQEGDRFHLKASLRDVFSQSKRLQSNVTGIGNIEQFDDTYWLELKMAQALTPAFITGSANNEDATWFYYLSMSDFVSIFPWISHNAWQFSPQMLQNSYVREIHKNNLAGNKFVWSMPFKDTAGKGIIASLGTGVYYDEEFKGVLVIDVDLASLNNKLPEISQEQHGYVLLNSSGQMMLHKSLKNDDISEQQHWQNVVPEPLQTLSQDQLMSPAQNIKFNGWLVQKYRLKNNGWLLVKYQPYSDFTSPLLNQFISIFGLFFVGLVIFLALVFFITRRAFVKPAIEFVAHIEHCAKGDPGKIQPKRDWVPWFQIVENIFGENRRLLQQLKEQNALLDSRVAQKTQALIKTSEQHQRDYVLLRSVINAIPEFIIFNDNDGNLIGCNKSFEQYIEQEEPSLLGKKVSSLLPDSLKATLEEFAALPVRQSQFGYSQTVETVQSTYDIFCTRFYNDAGTSLGSISIIRDVSEQYLVQSALKQAKEQAEFANDAKSQFLANMSHEIRTPINAIKGMMTLMEKTKLSAFQYQYLRNAQGASGALLHLIDELLDLSRIEAGKLELNIQTTELDSILDKVLQLNAVNAHRKGLSLSVDIESDVPYRIDTDEMRLVQVLANLLNNAVKFTHDGSITINIMATAHDKNNALIRFNVKDTGIGIAKDKQDKLFDAFSQADDSMTREYGGSGLGLSICQQIVSALGGEISVKSDLGQGSEFSFVLPVKVHNNQVLLKPLNVVTLSCPFNRTLAESVEKMGWCYQPIEQIEQLSKQVVNKETVLLIDGQYLADNKHISLLNIEKQFPNIKLMGICQPLMANVCEHIFSQLPELTAPYLLFEKPLYRFSLSRIIQHMEQSHVSLLNIDVNAKQAMANNKDYAEHSNVEGRLNNVNILLVEDNLVNQMVAQELLFSMGAKVEIAENGQVALDKLQANTFDVVLMDIQMPVMDGLTATRKIKRSKAHSQIPIIAMTAHARVEDKEASLAAGMELHIAKPVSAIHLCESILQVLAKETIDH
ncbi:ATP-binding protein [Thalassotalea atypica]|uniref:ATP-binding protein n=1 Tax=Thalassotalea atypica TaxID=2054316 RepID=UPI00257427D0|nr:ATP-binding protein [Thalassotalea atypica]